MTMNEAFRPRLDKCVIIYLDDILVYSRNKQQHLADMEDLFKVLDEHRLLTKGSKCEFFHDRLYFFGQVISEAGVEIDPKKLDTVKAWHPPTNITELQSFLGFVIYVRRFVPNMARLTAPLTDFVRKGVAFTWGEKEHAAFSALKKVICSPPVLRIADPHRPFEVVTDASDITIGAVLLQDFGNGLQPIAYESQKLHPPKKNYPIYDCEMLVIVHAFKVWRCYLTGTDMTVWTDHKSLQYLRAQPYLNPQQIRWLDFLESNFHYTQRRSETPSPQQLREWFSQRGASGGSGSCPSVIRTGDRADQTCGKPHTQHRCFSRLYDAWRAEFGDEAERPRWAELLRSGVAIFDLDYDAILAAMYALSISAEGGCHLCVPLGPGIEAAALGASESVLPVTAPAEALHTFTLDSGASRCFFCDSTTLTPLSAPLPVRLVDPSGGPVLARSSTALPCPAVPSGSLSGLHLPSFSTNLTLLLHHRLSHPSLPRLRGMHSRLLVSSLPKSLPPVLPLPTPPCLPCIEGRQCAAPHSSSSPPTTAPLQTLHMDVTYLSCVCNLDRGGEFCSDLLRDFCRWDGILHSFTLPDSPQKNGIAERRIGLVMELNLWPCVSLSETLPTLRWTGKVGDASVFQVWGSRAFVRDTSADKLSACDIPCVFLGFPPDEPYLQFYYPTSSRVLPSQDVTFDESVPFYRLLPYRSAPPPPPPLFLAPGPPPVDPLPPQGPTPSGAASKGATSGGAEPRGAESDGAGSGGAEPRGSEPGGAKLAGVEPGGAEPEGSEPWGAEFEGAKFGGAEPRGVGGTGGAAAAGPGGARTRAGDPMETGAAGAGGTSTGGAGAGGAGAGGAGGGDPGAVGARARGTGVGGAGTGGDGAGGAVSGGTSVGGTVRPRQFFVPLLQQLASPLPASSPYSEQSGGLTEHREPASHPVSPVRAVCTGHRVSRPHPPPVPVTHAMALRPSSIPLRVPLLPPTESSLHVVHDPESDLGHPDAPDIPTPRSYEEAITGPYSSQWEAAMDAEMASWKSTGTYVDSVPPSRANIVDGMWIFRVKRPPGSPPAFKARYVARGFSQRQGVDYFQSFSPTQKMTTLWVLLHVVAQRDYELHSLDFSTAFFLRRPVYGLRQAPREWHDTLRTTLAALGFTPTADPSLFLRTDMSLPPFYVLVYVLQRFGFQFSSPQPTPLSTSHSLSAPPSDESIELVGYLMTCTRPDLTYPLSLLARYVAPRSSCEAEIYAGAMAAKELRWLTYLLTNLGEQPRSRPVFYVDNKAMIALCQEHRLEHQTKHIALRYFLARELQQRSQLRLAYVATRANTANVFTKALPPSDH
ncbi:unnamed protein product [Closterium sp. NIES-53]